MTEFHELLTSIPSRLDAGESEAVRREFLDALGYDPADVEETDPEAGDVEPIAEGVPVVEGHVPSARRFVLRVGEDPMDDPPVPDHPEEVAYPTLRAIYDELDVDYAVHLTPHRIILYSPAFARTYVYGDHALDDRPTYERLTPEAARTIYDRLAVDRESEDQSSIEDY